MNEINDFAERDELVTAYSEYEDEFEYDYQKTKITPLDILKKFEMELTKSVYPTHIKSKIKIRRKSFFDFYSGAYF